MSLYSEDTWFVEEFCSDGDFSFQGEDHLLPGDDEITEESSQEGSFSSSLIDLREERIKCSLTDYPDLTNITSEPLVFPKDVRERKRNFSWSIATKFEGEEKLIKLKKRITSLCNKAILILNYDLGEILGYLNFTIEQSKEGFHSFFPGFKFVPARGGCNNNAELFLNYLRRNPNSRLEMCIGFSPEVFNVLTRY